MNTYVCNPVSKDACVIIHTNTANFAYLWTAYVAADFAETENTRCIRTDTDKQDILTQYLNNSCQCTTAYAPLHTIYFLQ